MRKSKNAFLPITLLCLIVSMITSCEGTKFQETPSDKFIGIWELKGRPMLDGIQIKIQRNKKEKLFGKVIKANDNRLVNIFVKPGDIWIENIKRTSNYEFRIIENKVGHQLFSLYDIESTKSYRAMIVNDTTIGLGGENANLTESRVKYVRVTGRKE